MEYPLEGKISVPYTLTHLDVMRVEIKEYCKKYFLDLEGAKNVPFFQILDSCMGLKHVC